MEQVTMVSIPSVPPKVSRAIVLLLVGLFSLEICRVYAASITVHFENGGYLWDAGWFAYLFGSSDITLSHPPSLFTNSFYHHHISPIFALWAMVFSDFLGLSSIDSFLAYTIVSGLVIFSPFAYLAMRIEAKLWFRLVVLLVGFILSYSNQFVFSALGYPHYELVFLGTCGLLYLFLHFKQMIFAYLTLVLMILIREDGGFFGSFVGLCYLATQFEGKVEKKHLSTSMFVAVGLIFSFVSLYIKATYFRDFQTFEGNFVGDHYAHVTADFVSQRFENLLHSAGILPLLVLLPLCMLLYYRTIAPLFFMLPLILLHFFAIRDVIGNFLVHYSIPFAVIMMIVLMQIFLKMAFFSKTRKAVAILVTLLLVVVTSAPINSMIGLKNASGGIFKRFVTSGWPERTYLSYQESIKDYLDNQKGTICGSIGIVALEPGLFHIDHFLNERRLAEQNPIDACDFVLMFKNDLAYDYVHQRIDQAGFSLSDKKAKIELYSK